MIFSGCADSSIKNHLTETVNFQVITIDTFGSLAGLNTAVLGTTANQGSSPISCATTAESNILWFLLYMNRQLWLIALIEVIMYLKNLNSFRV